MKYRNIDPGSVSGLGRSPGEENGYLLQYSCLEKSMTEEPGGLHLLLVRKAMTNLDSILKSRDNHFADRSLYSQSYGISSHVQMLQLDHK